jgi:hypothetical protein
VSDFEKTDPEMVRTHPVIHAAVIDRLALRVKEVEKERDNLRIIMSQLVHANEELRMKLAGRDD